MEANVTLDRKVWGAESGKNSLAENNALQESDKKVMCVCVHRLPPRSMSLFLSLLQVVVS